MNCRRKVYSGGYPCEVPYCSADLTSIMRRRSSPPAALGTTTRVAIELSDDPAMVRISDGGSTGPLGVGVNRVGIATVASRVSNGK